MPLTVPILYRFKEATSEDSPIVTDDILKLIEAIELNGAKQYFNIDDKSMNFYIMIMMIKLNAIMAFTITALSLRLTHYP